MQTDVVEAVQFSQIDLAQPQINQSGNVMKVKHTELLGPVRFSQDWTLGTTVYINPGLVESFPKLSDIINGNWEQYRFRSLEFIFAPSKGTQRDGLVSMAAEFDWNDGNPDSLQKMSQKPGYVSGTTWQKLIMKYPPPLNGHPKRFIRDGPEAMDPNETDVGRMFISVSDATAEDSGTTCGYLYARYSVELYHLDTTVVKTINSVSVRAPLATGYTVSANAVSAPYFFGNDLTPQYREENPNRMGLKEYILTGTPELSLPKRNPRFQETKDGFVLMDPNVVTINGFELPIGWYRLECQLNVSFTSPIAYTSHPPLVYLFIGTNTGGDEIEESKTVQTGSGSGDNYMSFHINCVYRNTEKQPISIRFANSTATPMTTEAGYLLITAQ